MFCRRFASSLCFCGKWTHWCYSDNCLGWSLSSVWLRSLRSNDKPLSKYSRLNLIINYVGFTNLIRPNCMGFMLVPAFSLSFILLRTFRYSFSFFWWWYKEWRKKGAGTYIRGCGYCIKAVQAWWMHCWCCCVWSLSALADSVWCNHRESTWCSSLWQKEWHAANKQNVTASALQTVICKPVSQPLLSASSEPACKWCPLRPSPILTTGLVPAPLTPWSVPVKGSNCLFSPEYKPASYFW